MSRPYVDRPIADGVAAGQAAAAAATEWGLPAPQLLRVGMNAIFRSGDVALRVSSPTAPASVSIELAGLLEDRGVDVLRPVFVEPFSDGGLDVTAWPFVDDVGEADWSEVGRQLRIVHSIAVADLPVALPRPSPVGFAWWDFEQLLADVSVRLDAPAREGIRQALERHAGWQSFAPDDAVVCHGDVHPGNVLCSPDGQVLIDWDLLCLAPPGWDHAPMMTWTERWGGASGTYEALAAGYGCSMRGDRWAEAFAELRLVAATLMRVKASLVDEASWPEADRRLAWWRGDADAPAWRAV